MFSIVVIRRQSRINGRSNRNKYIFKFIRILISVDSNIILRNKAKHTSMSVADANRNSKKSGCLRNYFIEVYFGQVNTY